MARVLVIDDSPLVRMVLCDLLADLGHDATAAATAEEAFSLCVDVNPELVFKDMVMKDIELAEFIREFRQIEDVPIVVCTTPGRGHEVTAAIKAGADDFLVKPFTHTEVANLVNRLLARRGA